MKLGVVAICVASAAIACAGDGAVDVERRHYERPADDGPIRMSVLGASLTLDPILHPQTELGSDGSTTSTWSTRVSLSEPMAHAESVEGSSIKLGRTANLDERGFDVVLSEAELRAALTGTPVRIKVGADGAGSFTLSLDIDAALLRRRDGGPCTLGPNLRPVESPSLSFEAMLKGASITAVYVDAAVAPELSSAGGAWRIGWTFEDLLTTAKWRNGAVRVIVTDGSTGTFESHATLAPAIHRVDVIVAD